MTDFKDAIEDTYHQAAYWAEVAAQESGRPFVMLKPSMAPDGDQWCALYGPNIMEGVCGFGDTPEAASRDFDENWHNQRTPAARQSDAGGE